MSISTPGREVHYNNTKKPFKNRYRLYSIFVILAIVPLLSADTFNFPQTVFTTGAEYTADIVLAKKIEAKTYDPNQAIADLNKKISTQIVKIAGQGTGAPQADTMAAAPKLSPTQIPTGPIDPNQPTSNDKTNPDTTLTNPQNTVDNPAPVAPQIKTLEELIPKPDSPQFRNQVVYSKVKVKAPMILSKLEDIYEKNSDGTINVLKPIVEKESDIKSGNYESTPIQKLLKNGVVHLADSVMPGEVGNSYLVGHSSNYRQVISNYNFVFATLTQAKEDDEFIVFDPDGRELKFKVFESIVIDYTDVATAYKDYGEKRIVTLQASVLVNGKPLKRRLVRGELVLQDR